MAKFHVNQETGAYGECTAQPGNCPVGGDSEQHFDNESDSKVASESKLKDIHGGSTKSLKKFKTYGSLPFSKEQFDKGIEQALDDIAEGYEDKQREYAYAYEEELSTPIYQATMIDPAEYAEVEITLDNKATVEYLSLASEKALRDAPEIFKDVMKTGYPFTDDKEEAAKIMSRDLIAILDKEEAFSLEVFPSLKGRVSVTEQFELIGNAHLDADGEGVTVSLTETMDRTLNSASRDTYTYDVGPSEEAMKELKKELNK